MLQKLTIELSAYREYIILTFALAFTSIIVIVFCGRIAPLVLLSLSILPALAILVSQYKGAFILFYLLITIAVLSDDVGIQPEEIPYFLASVILCIYTGLLIIKGSISYNTVLDKAFLLFVSVLVFSLFNGVLNGANLYPATGEFALFFGLILYFPLRENLTNPKFKVILIWTIGLIIIYVLIRNLVNYRTIIAQAVLPWQAEKARVAANELLLLVGASFTMSYAALTSNRLKQLVSIFTFLAFVGALILTQSRGYWLAFAITALAIFVIISKKGKTRILLTFFLISGLSLIFATIFFGDLLDLVINGILNRFQSIGSGKLDISLLERVLETKTVFQKTLYNPIAGYGLGVEFSKKILFFDHYISTSYVHLGYLATWYKFGLIGLLTNLFIWLYIFFKSRILLKHSKKVLNRVLLLTMFGTVTGMMLVNITSPQILTVEGNLMTGIFAALISHFTTSEDEY